MKHNQLALTIAAVLASSTGVVFAQGNTAASSAEKPRLEEVLVQARRTEENLQVVPVAVTAVTAEALQAATVSSMSDIQRLVPALQISPSNTGTQAFVIRGSFAEQFTDPGVITYVDEVPVDSRVLAYGLYDIASVQQLKGPQGTLFGKNSTGGAVLFFSQKPTHTESGYVRVRAGNYNERRFEGAFNVPVTDTLALRVAGQKETRDGFIESVTSDSEYDDRDNYSLRGSLLWTPTDAFENYTTLTHYRVDQHANATLLTDIVASCSNPNPAFNSAACMALPQPGNPLNGANFVLGSPNLAPYLPQQQALGRDQTVNDFEYPDKYDYDAITNITRYDFSFATLKNILHVSDIGQEFGRDYDGTPVDFYAVSVNADIKNYYDELQLFGKAFDERLEWRIGGVYSFSNTEEEFDQIALFRPGVNNTETDATSKAVFGQLSYDLSKFVDGVKITAGYRHTWDTREATIRDVNLPYPLAPTTACDIAGLPTTTPIADCVRNLKDDFDDFNYNVTLDWAINDQIFTYLATRRGYKSGGFNTASNRPDWIRYEPEIVEDYEWGIKTQWDVGNVPVRANVAVYQADYEAIQTTGLDVSSGAPAQVIINRYPADAPPNDATFKGFELELAIAPTAWWDLSAFYAEVDAQYGRSFTVFGASILDKSNEEVGQVVPKTQGVTSRFSLPTPADLGDVAFTVNYFNADKANSTNGDSVVKPRREQFDARLDWNNIAGSGVDVAVYGKNVTDSATCESTNLGLGLVTELCAPPRQYGIEVGYKFGD